MWKFNFSPFKYISNCAQRKLFSLDIMIKDIKICWTVPVSSGWVLVQGCFHKQELVSCFAGSPYEEITPGCQRETVNHPLGHHPSNILQPAIYPELGPRGLETGPDCGRKPTGHGGAHEWRGNSTPKFWKRVAVVATKKPCHKCIINREGVGYGTEVKGHKRQNAFWDIFKIPC